MCVRGKGSPASKPLIPEHSPHPQQPKQLGLWTRKGSPAHALPGETREGLPALVPYIQEALSLHDRTQPRLLRPQALGHEEARSPSVPKLHGQTALRAARTRPVNSPDPPPLNKTKASPAAPTSAGAQEGAQRRAAHAAPPGSSRPGLRSGGSRGGDGCSGGRGSGIRSLPRTQHLERRTAPRLIPLTPPSPRHRSQWRCRLRPGGCPLGGSGPSVETLSPGTARVFALPPGTCSLLGPWSGLVPRVGEPRWTAFPRVH